MVTPLEPAVGGVLRWRAGRPENRSLLVAARGGVVAPMGDFGHWTLAGAYAESGVAFGQPGWRGYLGGAARGLAGLTVTGGRESSPHAPVGADASDPNGPRTVWTIGLGLPLGPVGIEGRPFRVRGYALQADASPGAEEHASIFTFLRLARELRAMGAPGALQARCIDAARDEAVHAALHGFRSAWVPDLRARRIHPADLARESVADGVINEGRAADEAERKAGVNRAWEVIAADERRHAILSGDIAVWAAREAGVQLS